MDKGNELGLLATFFEGERQRSQIILMGESAIPLDVIRKVFKGFGVKEKNYTCHLDYNSISKSLDLKSLNKTNKTIAVLYGAIPHTFTGSELFIGHTGPINCIRDGYPPFIKLSAAANASPKITKQSLVTGLILLETHLHFNNRNSITLGTFD